MSKELRRKDLISLRDNFHKFESCFKEIKLEFDSFCEKSNQAAAKRARKKLMEISRMAKEIRNYIQDAKNNAVDETIETITIKELPNSHSKNLLKKLNPKLIELTGIDSESIFKI